MLKEGTLILRSPSMKLLRLLHPSSISLLRMSYVVAKSIFKRLRPVLLENSKNVLTILEIFPSLNTISICTRQLLGILGTNYQFTQVQTNFQYTQLLGKLRRE